MRQWLHGSLLFIQSVSVLFHFLSITADIYFYNFLKFTVTLAHTATSPTLKRMSIFVCCKFRLYLHFAEKSR